MRERFARRSRCRRHVIAAITLLTVSLVGTPAAGQGTSASIVGRVTDESGGILPGVTVVATSSALEVPQVTGVTDQFGEYRLTPLPIGSSQVVYSLKGFQEVLSNDGPRRGATV